MEKNQISMRQPMGRRMKVTVIVLVALLAVTLTATIVLAVFAARHTGSATLSFANGVTMQLEPTNTEGATIKISAQSSSATNGSFTYNVGSLTNIESNTVTLDGVQITSLSSGAYVAYKLQFSFKASGESTYTPIAGTWSALENNVSTFTPSTTPNAWTAKIYNGRYYNSGTANYVNFVLSNPSATSGELIMRTADSKVNPSNTPLFTKLEILGDPTLRIFASGSLKCDFVLSASTSSNEDAIATLDE